MRTELCDWLDAVYAILVETDAKAAEQVMDQLVVIEARIDPERARETWGQLPEHRAGAERAVQAQPNLPRQPRGVPDRPAHQIPEAPSGHR